MGSNQGNQGTSWGLIILACILFWPIGVFLIYRKLTCDKTATLKKSDTVRTISIVLAVIGVFSVLGGGGTTFTTIYGIVIFIIPSILLYRLHLRMKADGERYRKYIGIVVNQEKSLIKDIAPLVGVDAATARIDLEKMIKRGYFKDAYIDLTNDAIVLPRRVVETAAFEIRLCESCGAKAEVEAGKIGKCEYCDSQL